MFALTTTTVSMTFSTLPNDAISASSGIFWSLGRTISGTVTSCAVAGAAPEAPLFTSSSERSESAEAARFFFCGRFRLRVRGWAAAAVSGAGVGTDRLDSASESEESDEELEEEESLQKWENLRT